MATVVNNPPVVERDRGNGFLVGVILLIVLAVLFFYYGLPAIQTAATPQVSVPEQVDVNVNTPNQQ